MAYDDAKKSGGGGNLEEAIIAFVVLFFVMQVLFLFPSFVQEKLGVDTTFISTFLGFHPKLDINSPIGTKVLTTGKTNIWSDPGGGSIIGTATNGVKGTVVGGPVLFGDKLWWQIRYSDGTVGWVSGDDIGIDVEENSKSIKEDTPHGTKVQNKNGTVAYSSPVNGLVVGEFKKGEEGIIFGGPVYENGSRWWQVKYEDGTIGWVKEEDLEIDVKRNIKTLNDSTPFGTEIKNILQTEVLSGPRYGILLGDQLNGATGFIVGGPVTISTNRWWDIDYEEGVDGWVLEDGVERRFPVSDKANLTIGLLKKISYSISLLLFIAIVFIISALRRENVKERKLFSPLSTTLEESRSKNPRWEKVLEDVNSDNPNDWRHAIIEADILLDEVITKMSYHGATLGDKLQSIERSDFDTLDKAWEAHKARNAIAHEGSGYILSQREAKRIISLYQDVFEEFFFV